MVRIRPRQKFSETGHAFSHGENACPGEFVICPRYEKLAPGVWVLQSDRKRDDKRSLSFLVTCEHGLSYLEAYEENRGGAPNSTAISWRNCCVYNR